MFQLVYCNLGSVIGVWFDAHEITSLHDVTATFFRLRAPLVTQILFLLPGVRWRSMSSAFSLSFFRSMCSSPGTVFWQWVKKNRRLGNR